VAIVTVLPEVSTFLIANPTLSSQEVAGSVIITAQPEASTNIIQSVCSAV